MTKLRPRADDRYAIKRPSDSPKRPAHATVVAYLALFLALGGTAGALAGKNSVDSRDIKPKNVRASDLAKGAVGTSKLKDRAISTPKIEGDAVTGAKVLDATLGQTDLGADSVGPAELDLFKFDQRSGSVPVTGASGLALGPAITLQVPAGAVAVFYAEADIQVNGAPGASSCRLQARSGSTDVFLLQIDPGSGNPPQPYRSDLIPAVLPPGTYNFDLQGSVNGVTTNTCTYVNPALRGFVLG